jgi:hypothetical protein
VSIEIQNGNLAEMKLSHIAKKIKTMKKRFKKINEKFGPPVIQNIKCNAKNT